MEFSVYGEEYGMLAEGDEGKLTFQGSRYLGFERLLKIRSRISCCKIKRINLRGGMYYEYRILVVYNFGNTICDYRCYLRFFKEKATKFVSGFNSFSKEEQALYDKAHISRDIRNQCFHVDYYNVGRSVIILLFNPIYGYTNLYYLVGSVF